MTVERLCALLGIKVERYDAERWIIRATRDSGLQPGPVPPSLGAALDRLA